jgi:hypothetical protein
MSKEGKSLDIGKSENLEVRQESEVGSPKSEIKNNSAIQIPQLEINEPQTANSKLLTENMEVHHHPEVEKKTFKEYLLEGLMIFLAVLMGFIAENIREGISEHKRAAEFARSYYEDIKKDTAALHTAMRFSKQKLAGLDSALIVLHHLTGKQKEDTVLYTQLSLSASVVPFDPSEGTYEQIKSSGSLRYFDQKLVSLMNSYDVQVKRTGKREDIDLRFILDQYLPYIIKNFNSEIPFDDRFLHHISHELYIIDRSKNNMRQMINYVIDLKIERLLAEKEYKGQIKISDEVLSELKKEYSLDNE